MFPTLMSPPTSLCYARPSVGDMYLRTMIFLTTLLNTASHRSFIHSGDEDYRLSSNQSLSEVPDSKRSLILAAISKLLLFGFPDRYEARFKSFWAGQLVDTSRWHERTSEMVEDLKQMMSWVSRISAVRRHSY